MCLICNNKKTHNKILWLFIITLQNYDLSTKSNIYRLYKFIMFNLSIHLIKMLCFLIYSY